MANVEYKVERLSAKNYQTWKTVITSQLMSKDLWEVVVESKNDTDQLKIRNEAAKHLMYISMEPQQIAETGKCESAYDLWAKIRENHEGAESNLSSQALADFLGLRYRKNESINSFAARYEIALSRLSLTTGIDRKSDPNFEKTKLWVLSNTLPEHMQVVVRMFSMAKPNGTTAELITQLKIGFHSEAEQTKESTAFHAQESSTNRSRRNDQKPNGAERPGQRQKPKSCSYCKKDFHVWEDCRKRKYDNQRKFNQQSPQSNNSQPNRKTDNQTNLNKSGAFNMASNEFTGGKHIWIVDSGASCHMTQYKEFLKNYTEFKRPHLIKMGNGKHIAAYGSGEMPFTSGWYEGYLTKVLWAPEMKENLFSVISAMGHGCHVTFGDSNVEFFKRNTLILKGDKTSTYFLLKLEPIYDSSANVDHAYMGASLEEWHKRLSHCSADKIKELISSEAVRGLKVIDTQRKECEPCVNGKITRVAHPDRQQNKADANNLVLHFDSVGPIKTMSIGGSRYFLLATEEHSGYRYIETTGSKGSIPDLVKAIINRAELESKRRIKSIVSDNGSEFLRHDLLMWLREKGVYHRKSCTYTPQQNGLAERSNRTILDGIRTVLYDAHLPEELWAEAARTVVYTNNRLIRKDTKKTCFELFRGTKPDISNLRTFGQQAIIRLQEKDRKGKLAPRGEKALFVGYTERHNTFRFYITEPFQQVYEACDVKFLPKTLKPAQEEEERTVRILSDDLIVDDDTSSTLTEIDTTWLDTIDTNIPFPENEEYPTLSFDEPDLIELQPLREVSELNNQPITEAAASNKHVALFSLDNEPQTYNEAKERSDWPKWRDAMNDEIEALNKNHTWTLVDKPSKAKLIRNKWVFKVKLQPDGEVERFKARLVAKGYSQVQNVDYKETYAPVASMTTIRMFLALANQHSMHLVQFDIKTAFLYGELEEVLHMEQPEGYKIGDKVCRLNKSLYGLKQSPRCWNRKFDSFLKMFNLKQGCIDKCLYFNEDKSLMLTIYVDDGLAAGKDREQLDKLIEYLKNHFELKVMNCQSFLGLEVIRDRKMQTLSIVQSQYVEKILTKFGMSNCNPVSTPEQVGAKFEESAPLPTEFKFKELVGSLLYLSTCTRPDISHAVSIASRTSEPTQSHWNALKRILRYLKGTKDLGITYKFVQPNELVGYSDADYANDEVTRKSTTGLCIFLGTGPIAWRCQRQPIITLSTTEAEYVAGCELVKELIPIREQLIELNEIDESKPVPVFIDNQSTVKIATNESGQSRTKHIDIRQKWLTEQSQQNKIEVKHISGDEQTADLLTKPLYKTRFITNRSKLLNHIISSLVILSIVSNPAQGKNLKLTDPLTTVKSEYEYVSGDNRYKLTNIFLNPCETLFNYSSSIITSRLMTKNCFEYYDKKILRSLSNCRKLPTVGEDLSIIPSTYDCQDSSIMDAEGKCTVTQRTNQRKQNILKPASEIKHDERWLTLSKKVNNLPKLSREERAFPLIPIAAGLSFFISSISWGNSYKSIKMSETALKENTMIMNVTNAHSDVIRESYEHLSNIRDSISKIITWAEDVEERLVSDIVDPRMSDPTYKGKMANLVRTYMKWFSSQEKLLNDINWAAEIKRIPSSLRAMVNLTDNFELATNWSNLYDCNYHLENKSLVLELDFSLPIIDSNIEVLNVVPMSVYHARNDTGNQEYCWTTYVGPERVLHNKTSSCITKLHQDKVYQKAVRAQVCLGGDPDMEPLFNGTEIWREHPCSQLPPFIEDRIQIQQIDGYHKIYCYPYSIEIEKEVTQCPLDPFIIEGHANYRVGNVSHNGIFFDTTIERSISRPKRSPVSSLPTTTMASTDAVKTTIKLSQPILEKADVLAELKNQTNRMNATLELIGKAIEKIPAKLNITREDFDEFFAAPLELIQSGLAQITKYISGLGSGFALMGLCMMIILIMPALEILIIGIKVAKIPASLWINSAKRVKHHLVDDFFTRSGRNPFRKTRKRWDDGSKAV